VIKKRKKLMIVDDMDVQQTLVAQAVIAYGGIDLVPSASNGLAAERYAKTHQPDLVTMDMTMPKQGGTQTIRNLVEMFPDIKIIAITALSDFDTNCEAQEAGAVGFLRKPFKVQEFHALLRELGI
jgi:two-component system chemotaxis response regulator CheY